MALIVLTVAIIQLYITTKQIIKEIEMVNFELSLLRRQDAECEHRLTNIEDVLGYMRYYNATKEVRNENN